MARSRVGLLLISVALVAAGCSSTDDEPSAGSSVPDVPASVSTPGPTSSSTTAPATVATASESALLVQRFAAEGGGVAYLLVGSDGSELAGLTAPDGFDEQFVISGVTQAVGATSALVETPAGLVTLDAVTLELEPFLPGAEVRWRDPEGRFLVVTVDGLLEVVDGRTLTRYPLDSAGPVGSVGAAGDRVALTVVGQDDVHTVVVDAADGTVTALPEGDRTTGVPFDGAGERLAVTRTGDRDGAGVTQIAVSPAASPGSAAVWFESERGPTAAWAGDALVVAEAIGGRVLVASEDEAVEIGTLAGDGRPAVFGDPERAGALVLHDVGDTTRWYHVDAEARTLTPLPELDGMDLSATILSDAGVLVLDDAVDGSDRSVGRVVAVRPADGEITELFTANEREVLTGGALGPTLVALGPSGGMSLELFDLAVGDTILIEDGVFVRLSPDPTVAAAAVGSSRTRSVALVDLGSGTVEPLTDGQPVGWLQR